MLRRTLLTALLVGLLCLGLNGGPPPVRAQLDDWIIPYRPALLPDFVNDMAAYASAPRYTIDLALTVTEEHAILTGHQQVLFTNRQALPLDEIVFRLFPNLNSYGANMTVRNVTVDGVLTTPSLDETRSVLSVPLTGVLAGPGTEPVEPGASIQIDMDFTITVTAGVTQLYAQFSYLDGVLALPNAYPVLSVYEPDSGWWAVTEQPQGDAVYSETAFYTVNLTAPADQVIAASGSLVDLITHPDGTLTHRYVAPLMRDFAFFASPQYVTVTGEQDGVSIHVYYDPAEPGSTDTARAGLTLTQESVRVFNTLYGRYPFAELDVVQTPTTAGGIEYPGVFVVATSVWDRTDSFFEFVTVHEAAHQWWYSLVGNDQTLDPWIDEALAQYSVALYIRDHEGEVAYAAALDAFRQQHTNFAATHDDQQIGLPVTAYPGSAYFYMVYQKGPLFYAALDERYGTERVIAALRDLFTAYRYGVIEADDMRASFEASLGVDLDAFFEEWVAPVPVG